MTDKQIIDDLKEMIYKLQMECVEKTDNILALGDQLKTAETVIEILEAKIGGHEYAISDIVKEYQGKLDQLKETNEGLLSIQYKLAENNKKLRQTLADIKPILEYYENSKIGEKQEDGSYKLEFIFSDIATPYCINYDPKPAREALQKINEVENES